jgi:hypothetical protein
MRFPTALEVCKINVRNATDSNPVIVLSSGSLRSRPLIEHVDGLFQTAGEELNADGSGGHVCNLAIQEQNVWIDGILNL